MLKTLYTSLVLPYLTYAIEVWYGAYKNITEYVNVMQKRCIRYINLLPYNHHSTNYFKQMNILKLADSYTYHLIIFMYRSLVIDRGRCPITIQCQHDIHDHNTRDRALCTVPLYSRSKSQHSVSYRAVKAWNDLSSNIKKSRSLTQLKRSLRSSFAEQY